MMIKLVLSSVFTTSLIWLLLTATSATAQTPILDTRGQPLLRGVEYYIKPVITNNGGGLTLIDRNNSCPWYAGQENDMKSRGIPVTFSPFLKAENVVMESMSFEVAFAKEATSKCPNTTTNWKVSTMETSSSGSQPRFIETGGNGTVLHYFQVYLGSEVVMKNGSYGLRWCPAEVCPYCRVDCGFVEVVVENGNRLLALNSTSAFPVVFERAA